MSNPYFQFKQFTVWHDKCAMKVGTDSVLLGTWADVSHAKNILDVGAGTALISLMMAQRSDASIYAVEIDENAVCQAKENIKRSPWQERIHVVHSDYSLFDPEIKFDLIVSNPPYFSDSLQSPDNQRNTARHTKELTYEELIKKTASLLHTNGIFSLVLPIDILEKIKIISAEYQLFPIRQTNVYTKPGIPAKRVLISFGFNQTRCITDNLTIELSRHVYTEEFKALTKDFYLYVK